MAHVSKEEIKRIQGSYQLKYGEIIDPMTAMLLYEVEDIKRSDIAEKNEILASIHREINEMKEVYRPFTTTDFKVAFFYGVGKYTWAWLSIFVIALGVILNHVKETTMIEYRTAKQVLERYPNIVILEALIKNGKVVEKKQGTFLEVEPATKKLLVGNTYVTDPEKAMNKEASKILIPLSFK
ncbi:hypothetical protein FEM33_10170 [Dyadobacter flavalbus]|uniref:Uncharacterized protein n=1 Tax=Dyadobacter flavalbus TaxID=2579942 RepID=A0A5M8QZV5_9BACT|nr:hypothetical protein [Dyadobacter flavalbus]KAA6439923.1 hypothetical protein FEM33_10170 [Dyadobacter flavalbus]